MQTFIASLKFLPVSYGAKIFLLKWGQLAGLIYDLFINKCHYSGLFSYLALILGYVVYESCQLDDVAIKNVWWNFFVKNILVLAGFLLRKNYGEHFFIR